jgi:hypothetical protein
MKFCKLLIIFPAFLISIISFATNKVAEYSLQQSTIQYQAKHLLHNFEGTSQSAKGKIRCDTECQGLVAVEVKSFDSDNTNRDQHMQKITKAASIPLVSLRFHAPKDLQTWNEKNVNAELTFAGENKQITFKKLLTVTKNNSIENDIEFSFSLTDFKVDRPGLLGVPLNDNVVMTIKAEWK